MALCDSTYQFPLHICNKHVCFLQCFRNITTYLAYMTASEPAQSFTTVIMSPSCIIFDTCKTLVKNCQFDLLNMQLAVCEKTEVHRISCGIDCLMSGSVMLPQEQHVTDRQDSQTELLQHGHILHSSSAMPTALTRNKNDQSQLSSLVYHVTPNRKVTKTADELVQCSTRWTLSENLCRGLM